MQTPETQRIKVMIADDSTTVRTIFRDILKDTEFDLVGEVQNGQEAVEHYKRVRPDLVIMDIIMPELDGVVALSNILDFDPGARVIMASSLGTQRKVLDSIKRGAKNFVMKPYDPDVLIEAMRKACREFSN